MIKNKVIKLGDNVDTDQILGAQHLRLETIKDMAPFLFETEETFLKDYHKGNIVVGGRNFGCGSSREQAPAVMKERGVSAIVAKSFARIFYRNAVNLGIPVFICPNADEIQHQHVIVINLKKESIYNENTGATYCFDPIPEFVKEIFEQGGIAQMIRQR